MVLWHAKNIFHMMNIMTAKFHVNNLCVFEKKYLKYTRPPLPQPHCMWNGLESFHVK